MRDRHKPEEVGDRDIAAGSSASPVQPLDGDLRSIESALAQLRPRADQLNRDRLLFLAGQASVAEGAAPSARDRFLHWFWPTSSVAMTGVAATLLVALVMRSDPPAVERLVYVAPGAAAGTRASPTEIGRAAVETDAIQYQSAPPGVWTVKQQFRFEGDLLGPESLAQVGAPMPDDQPASAGDPAILSSRSFKELLDDSSESRGTADRPRLPGAISPGAKS